MHFTAFSQIKRESEIYIVFKIIEDKENVNGNNAKVSLQSYLTGKTNLHTSDKENADYYFILSVVMEKRKRFAQITVIDAKTKEQIWQSEWQLGRGNSAYYGYSGTRMAVGKLVKGPFLDQFPEVKQ